jgi:regulator of sirC expression with transglutaminase-like and TPR domain
MTPRAPGKPADDPPLRAFTDVALRGDPDVDLALAALHIARVEHPGLVPQRHLEHLDELAARSGAGGVADALHALHRLREFLFDEIGLRGNAADYYDPRNSCLNDVLQRKLGIPITLSLVMIEVGRRVGLRIAGVGLPGHFVVSARVGTDRVLLDPFDGGAVLTLKRAAELAVRAVGRPIKLTESDLAPCSKRQIIVRMLENLKGIYVTRNDWAKAMEVLNRLLVVDRGSPAHVRDRGAVLLKLGDLPRAATDWERYLGENPDAPDAERVRHQLRRVRQELAVLN